MSAIGAERRRETKRLLTNRFFLDPDEASNLPKAAFVSNFLSFLSSILLLCCLYKKVSFIISYHILASNFLFLSPLLCPTFASPLFSLLPLLPFFLLYRLILSPSFVVSVRMKESFSTNYQITNPSIKLNKRFFFALAV
jgi:hypothetical protein